MTPTEQNDQRWFEQHPKRTYRLRRAIGDEALDGPSRAVHFSANFTNSRAVQTLAIFDTEANAKEAFHSKGAK
ncbi:MAG: hypothetical protein GY952_17560 [Rhodobacteraceae bacterium]|nr:hypothetical protein [Paracoccaceae bacterium]